MHFWINNTESHELLLNSFDSEIKIRMSRMHKECKKCCLDIDEWLHHANISQSIMHLYQLLIHPCKCYCMLALHPSAHGRSYLLLFSFWFGKSIRCATAAELQRFFICLVNKKRCNNIFSVSNLKYMSCFWNCCWLFFMFSIEILSMITASKSSTCLLIFGCYGNFGLWRIFCFVGA